MQLSGRSLPVVSWGRDRSALSVSGPRAEERRHPQTAHSVREQAVCVRKRGFNLLCLYPRVTVLMSAAELLLCVFQEMERRWSSDPQSVCELIPGSSVARSGDHGDVWTSCFTVKPDRCFGTELILHPPQGDDSGRKTGSDSEDWQLKLCLLQAGKSVVWFIKWD